MCTLVTSMGPMWHDGATRLPEHRSQSPTYLHYHQSILEEEYGVFLPLRKP